MSAAEDLAGVLRSGLSFDLVLASAVWQHVAPGQRARAFRKLASVLKPGGLLALTSGTVRTRTVAACTRSRPRRSRYSPATTASRWCGA